MLQREAGFTLIELVMVIVVLGILAVTAIPQFTDLSSSAQTAAEQGVAGAISSATMINYSRCAAKATPTAQPITSCASITSSVLRTLVTGIDTAVWSIDTRASGASTTIAPGGTATCKMISPYHASGSTGQPSVTVIGTNSSC